MLIFQIFVESISLCNKLLLPLTESVLFLLDLFGELLTQAIFLFLEFGVGELLGPMKREAVRVFV
jgi:hypothetical protein